MSNIEVRSKLTNPPKLRSKVSNISPSREGNCELNRNAFPRLARKQTVGERKLRNIPSRSRRKRESGTLAPLIPNIFSRHTLQLGLNLLRFTSTSPPAEIPICSVAETGHGMRATVDEKEEERNGEREREEKKGIKGIKEKEKRQGWHSVGRRKLGGRGKKGRVFARARGGICIYTQARARVCKIENGKSG